MTMKSWLLAILTPSLKLKFTTYPRTLGLIDLSSSFHTGKFSCTGCFSKFVFCDAGVKLFILLNNLFSFLNDLLYYWAPLSKRQVLYHLHWWYFLRKGKICEEFLLQFLYPKIIFWSIIGYLNFKNQGPNTRNWCKIWKNSLNIIIC